MGGDSRRVGSRRLTSGFELPVLAPQSSRGGTRRRSAYWRHGPAREDDRACGLDDLLEVRRGIQVLVLDFHRAIDEAEADSSVCSRIYHLGLRTRLLREHTRMKTYRRWTR